MAPLTAAPFASSTFLLSVAEGNVLMDQHRRVSDVIPYESHRDYLINFRTTYYRPLDSDLPLYVLHRYLIFNRVLFMSDRIAETTT